MADALSRKSSLATITLLQTNMTGLVKQALQGDAFFNKVTSTLSIEGKTENQRRITEGFTLVDGLLYFGDHLYIPPNHELKLKILTEAHDIQSQPTQATRRRTIFSGRVSGGKA